MLDKTDEAAGAILDAIREVTPGVAEQAVAYWQVVDMVWLGIFGTVMLISTIIAVWWWFREGCGGDLVWTVIGSIVACVALFICTCLACDLAKTYYAPDYYAAECMIDLSRKALGK